jgi:diacylglycerol kinase family enzyme
LLGLEEGKHVELRDIRYVKAKAVILEPETAAGHIMIDGERLPQVGRVAMEVHPGLVNVFVGT